jgi:hypothetical protein
MAKGKLLKEIALIAVNRRANTAPVLERMAAAASTGAATQVRRRHVSRVVSLSDPRAIGGTSAYNLLVETWFDANPTSAIRRASWFEELAPDAMRFVNRAKSVAFISREYVVRKPPPAGVNIVSVLRRTAAMDAEEFSRYWRNEHVAVVRSAPDFWRNVLGYVQNHPAGTSAKTLSGDCISDIDGITQLWFADDAAAVQAFLEPAYLKIVRPDEFNLRSGPPVRMLVEKIEI